MDCSIDDAHTDAPAAAAADIPAIPVHGTLHSTPGQRYTWRQCQMLSKLRPVLIDAPMYCAYWRVGALRATVGATPRVDSDGQPACELCDRRLSKVKYTHPHNLGRACHPRCKPSKRAVDDDAPKEPPAVRSHKRAKSDPGEKIALTATRTRPHRITAPKPLAPPPKPRISKPTVDVSSLLDQAHARRMALLEAEKSGAGSSATSDSAVVWQ